MFLSRTPERIETERHLRDVARLEEVRRLEDLLVAYAVLLHRFLKGGGETCERESMMLPIHPRPFFCGQQPPILTHLKGADVLHEQEGWPACLELLDRARRDLVHELAKHHAVLQYLRV